ncbi:ABC transporter permease [Aureimonas jatrophae]|uniref:Monosaccharide ABC transporter membrane protein, CUT2 family n=1 Tax=Aureimonas jatrophae TaxID=1166073 RepID=A0A1H0KCS3_9HYPH|nr:ABC transporter permease [Aureimonas jatrophae]MBB3951062.1 ribose transport system permease protein [Aureimonas jatrophae]SDO53636.1 monosaccharide ABC transporter membrane protein, CUT2 family [Aureimonas jatrophae]
MHPFAAAGRLAASASPMPTKAKRSGNQLERIVTGVLTALVLVFSVSIDGFLSLGNLQVILSNSASLAILSCGMAVVVISRGLDLSLVAQMTAGATVFGILLANGVAAPVAVGASLAAIVLIGFLNAWLIAYVEIPAMLATLASSMFMVGFLRFAVLRGEFLLLLPKSDPTVAFLASSLPIGLSVPVLLMLATVAATWFLLARSTAGRITYAMGDNFQAARLTGLPVRRTTIVVYVFAGLTALVAGLVTASASGAVDFRTVTNGTLIFDVILAVVLGGIPLRGGRGGVRNIVVGVALIAVLRNGMTLMDFTTQTQDMLKGVVLLSAIVVDNHFNPRDAETDTVGDL